MSSGKKVKFAVITKKHIFIISCVAIAVIFTVCLATKGVSIATAAATRKIPIYSVATTEKRVCLTFDAAWGNEDTQNLIDILGKYDIKATFFIVGDWVEKYPESVKALSDAGHSIQNHSNKHPHLPQLSREQIANEIESCNDKIEKITGVRPTLIRVPYGDYSNSVIEVVEELGMYTIQWDVDSLDWKDLSASEINSRVINNVREGSIVLFHNAALHTPEALPSIIEYLKQEGYKFMTVKDMIYTKDYEIDHEGRQQPVSKTLGSNIDV